MSNKLIGDGAYSWRKDKDKKGVFYWVVDPSGKDLVPLDQRSYVDTLLAHLNRSKPLSQAQVSKGAHRIVPPPPGADLSPFPLEQRGPTREAWPARVDFSKVKNTT